MTWTTIPVIKIHTAVAQLTFAVEAHGCYIAGGYARWACTPAQDYAPTPRDIDIICPSPRKLEAMRAALSVNGYRQIRDGQFSFTFEGKQIDREIQLLKFYHGDDIEACLDQFDLSVCRVALLSHDSAIADTRFLPDVAKKQITVCRVSEETPENTLLRLIKYGKKGFDTSVEEALKVINAIKRTEFRRIHATKDQTLTSPSRIPIMDS